MSLDVCPLPNRALPRCDRTDLPRLLCGCPEHTRWNAEFDYDDLEPAEHAYLQARDQQPTVLTLTVARAVRVIPEYGTAQPWTTAQNPPLPATGRTCDVCHKRPAGDAFVCPDCTDDLRVHLADVPGLLNDLAVAAQRQAVVNRRPREQQRTHGTRWDAVLKPTAKRLHEDSTSILLAANYHRPLNVERATLARQQLEQAVRTAFAIVLSAPADHLAARPASRTLLNYLRDIAGHPKGPDACRALRTAHRQSMAAIDGDEDGVYLGICDGPPDTDQSCGTSLMADPEAAEHRCPVCGTTHDVAQRRRQQRDRVLDKLLTVTEIVTLADQDHAIFGGRVHKKQLQRWIDQGRLTRASGKPVDGRVEPVALYRASDVLALTDERSRR